MGFLADFTNLMSSGSPAAASGSGGGSPFFAPAQSGMGGGGSMGGSSLASSLTGLSKPTTLAEFLRRMKMAQMEQQQGGDPNSLVDAIRHWQAN